MDDDDWCAPDSHCMHFVESSADSGWSYICCSCGWNDDAE